MMLIHGLDIKIYCYKIFEKQERDKRFISCLPFPHISMILNIHRVWYSSQNKQQDEESFIKKDPRIIHLASQSQTSFTKQCKMQPFMQFSLVPTGSPTDEDGCRKSLYSDRVHSWRFNKSTRAPAPPLLPLPWDLLGHHGREPGHDNPDLSERSASHPHVLFPQQPVLCGSLLLLCHYP